ncbi:DNA adenine methylase Dam [Leptolyngbya sp. PCC 7375]|nr:DNA adenine methylase Dam [Leptolyngbya sp. PCC 7375]
MPAKLLEKQLTLFTDPVSIIQAKPFVKWAGGKAKLLSELAKRLPPSFSTYYEPFVGGGALYFKLQPGDAVLSDRNFELVNCYKAIRDYSEDLIDDLKIHRYKKEYYYNLRDADRDESFLDTSSIYRASRFIYLNKTCFNGLYRVNKKGEFNTPIGRYRNPTICDEGNLLACSELLQGVTIEARDYQTVEVHANSGDFVYFDPPYKPVSDTSNFTSYTADGFGVQDQHNLAELCVNLSKKGVKFMLSNSDCDFILDLYKGFNIDRVRAPRSINSKGSKRGKVGELIIRNY